MENRLKEQQLDLFADRTSTQTFESNQLRRWLSSIAYFLICLTICIKKQHNPHNHYKVKSL